jgi:hypothetical protein
MTISEPAAALKAPPMLRVHSGLVTPLVLKVTVLLMLAAAPPV